MPIKTINNPKFQALDSTGAPLSGGLLYTYTAGTSTPKATYSDIELATPNANPVVLDSRGEATIFGQGAYKFVLKTSADVEVWTVDNITASQGGNTAARVGIGDYSDDLTIAIATIAGAETTLVIDKEITLTANDTVPETITLEKTRGGSFTEAYTLTINGGMIGDMSSKWFDSSVTLAGTPKIDKIPAVIFGLLGDNLTASAAANQTAIDAAMAWASSSGVNVVTLPQGTIYLNAEVDFPGDRLVLEGVEPCYSYEDRGTCATELKWTGGAVTNGIDMMDGTYATWNYYNTLRNMRINGNSLVVNGVYAAGQMIIEGVEITETTTVGLLLGNYTNATHVKECSIVENTGTGLKVEGPLTSVFTIEKTNIRENGGDGVVIEGFYGAKMDTVVIESNTGQGLVFDIQADGNLRHVMLANNVYLENNQGTYQLDMTSAIASGSLYVEFNGLNLNAPAAAGNLKKQIHIGTNGALQPVFNGGKFAGGDTNYTQAEKIVIDSSAVYPTFNDIGSSAVNGVTNATSVNDYLVHQVRSTGGFKAGSDLISARTVVKTINIDSTDTVDDYQLNNTAADMSEQVVAITNIVPAYGYIVSMQLRCIETVTGSNTMTIDIGYTSGGGQFLAATAVDTANDTKSGDTMDVVSTAASARTIYVNLTPGVNWNTLTEGRWVMMVTYHDYGVAYTQRAR